MTDKRSARLVLLLAGSVLLLVYLFSLDFSGLARAFWSFPIWIALVVLAMDLLPGAIKFLRWRYFLSRRGLPLPGWNGYLAVNASFFLGLVTPGTVGEFSRPWVGESGETGRAAAIVLFEKVSDLAVLVLLAISCAALVLLDGAIAFVMIVGACLIGVLLYLLFLQFDGVAIRLANGVVKRLLSTNRLESLRTAYGDFYSLAESRRSMALSLGTSALLWVVSLVQLQLIFVGFGWEVSLPSAGMVLFVPYLIAVLSLIPLGIGAFELSMSEVIGLGSMANAVGVSGAVIPLFFRFLVSLPLVLGGYVCHVTLLGRRKGATYARS